jgi:chromosome segregation protein
VKDKLEKQVEFDKDIEFCTSVDEQVGAWLEGLEGAIEEAKENFDGIEAHTSKHNAPLFTTYDAKLAEMKKTVAEADTIAKSVKKIQGDLVALRKQLDIQKDGSKDEFAETVRELVKALEAQGVTSIAPDDYVKLTKQKAALEKKIADLDKKTSKEQALQESVLAAITTLNDGWHAEFQQIAGALAKINSAQPALKVKSNFKGDKPAFIAKMEETFRGYNIRRETYNTLSEAYADFAAIYKDLDKAAAHARGKAEAFKDIFLERLGELLSFQVPNSYDVSYHGKPLRSHSLGQRASAMMLFLLSQDDSDLLLIDQPEDDLDSQTVYEEVVKLLRTIKARQQFIFATHNANFPVLGDAEHVAACRQEDDRIAADNGSIDTKGCQGKIVDIMEGGSEAFDRRKTIYQAWKNNLES